MRVSDKAKVWTGLVASALLLAGRSLAQTAPLITAPTIVEKPPVPDHSRFCIPQGAGWVVQPYAPLVDTKKGTKIEQAVYNGEILSHVLMKTYNDRYELMYDYHFDETGRLVQLRAYLERWGQWLAEADLYPESSGLIPHPDVHYRLSQFGGIVPDPKDGANETKVFLTAPVYWSVAQVPCAVLLREAEKMNATQE
jgi:hypothetical protein